MNGASGGPETPLETAIETYVTGLEAGNYRTNVASVLDAWRAWMHRERDVTRPGDVAVLDCRRFAARLKRRVHDDEITASTAHTYYAYVRSFLSWCVDEERLDTNPAQPDRATSELPEDVGDTDQQFWRPADRKALFRFVSSRAHDALDADPSERVRAFRDRALVYVLGLSGVRSAEIVRSYQDDKRTGVTWGDLDLDGGAMRVLGKNRQYEYAQLPAAAVEALDRYRRVLDPPTDDWPVFPTGHAPSRYAALREGLREQGYDEETVEELLETDDTDVLLREHEIAPPAVTTHGARSIMKGLCEEAGLDIDGEYLKPHGARRGLGDLLYRENPALAQQALRHKDLRTTHERYSDIRASEVSSQVDDVLGED